MTLACGEHDYTSWDLQTSSLIINISSMEPPALVVLKVASNDNVSKFILVMDLGLLASLHATTSRVVTNFTVSSLSLLLQ